MAQETKNKKPQFDTGPTDSRGRVPGSDEKRDKDATQEGQE